jgi:hypothetical protein
VGGEILIERRSESETDHSNVAAKSDGEARQEAEEFREGNDQIDRQEEQIAHEFKIITAANLHNTSP